MTLRVFFKDQIIEGVIIIFIALVLFCNQYPYNTELEATRPTFSTLIINK